MPVGMRLERICGVIRRRSRFIARCRVGYSVLAKGGRRGVNAWPRGIECDRSFTRSDALAKHMRTVHETEALRPSDPVPKSHPLHPQNASGSRGPGTAGRSAPAFYGAEDGYDSDEEKLPPKELLRLLKQKQTWAEREQRELTDAVA